MTKITYLIFADSSIEARAWSAIVDVGLTEPSDEPFPALALELVVQVETLRRSGRVAKVGGTLVDGRLAVQAGVAGAAVANKAEFAIC